MAPPSWRRGQAQHCSRAAVSVTPVGAPPCGMQAQLPPAWEALGHWGVDAPTALGPGCLAGQLGANGFLSPASRQAL